MNAIQTLCILLILILCPLAQSKEVYISPTARGPTSERLGNILSTLFLSHFVEHFNSHNLFFTVARDHAIPRLAEVERLMYPGKRNAEGLPQPRLEFLLNVYSSAGHLVFHRSLKKIPDYDPSRDYFQTVKEVEDMAEMKSPPKEYCVLLRMLGAFSPSSSSTTDHQLAYRDLGRVFENYRIRERTHFMKILKSKGRADRKVHYMSAPTFITRLVALGSFIDKHIIDQKQGKWILPVFAEFYGVYPMAKQETTDQQEEDLGHEHGSLLIVGRDQDGMFISNFDIYKEWGDSYIAHRFDPTRTDYQEITKDFIVLLGSSKSSKFRAASIVPLVNIRNKAYNIGDQHSIVTRQTLSKELLSNLEQMSAEMRDALARVVRVLSTFEPRHHTDLASYYESGDPFALEFVPPEIIIDDEPDVDLKELCGIARDVVIHAPEGNLVCKPQLVNGIYPYTHRNLELAFSYYGVTPLMWGMTWMKTQNIKPEVEHSSPQMLSNLAEFDNILQIHGMGIPKYMAAKGFKENELAPTPWMGAGLSLTTRMHEEVSALADAATQYNEYMFASIYLPEESLEIMRFEICTSYIKAILDMVRCDSAFPLSLQVVKEECHLLLSVMTSRMMPVRTGTEHLITLPLTLYGQWTVMLWIAYQIKTKTHKSVSIEDKDSSVYPQLQTVWKRDATGHRSLVECIQRKYSLPLQGVICYDASSGARSSTCRDVSPNPGASCSDRSMDPGSDQLVEDLNTEYSWHTCLSTEDYSDPHFRASFSQEFVKKYGRSVFRPTGWTDPNAVAFKAETDSQFSFQAFDPQAPALYTVDAFLGIHGPENNPRGIYSRPQSKNFHLHRIRFNLPGYREKRCEIFVDVLFNDYKMSALGSGRRSCATNERQLRNRRLEHMTAFRDTLKCNQRRAFGQDENIRQTCNDLQTGPITVRRRRLRYWAREQDGPGGACVYELERRGEEVFGYVLGDGVLTIHRQG